MDEETLFRAYGVTSPFQDGVGSPDPVGRLDGAAVDPGASTTWIPRALVLEGRMDHERDPGKPTPVTVTPPVPRVNRVDR